MWTGGNSSICGRRCQCFNFDNFLMSRSIIASDLLTEILLGTSEEVDSTFDQDYSTTVPTLGNGRKRTVVRRVILHIAFKLF
jgi:hypothetical protein